MSNSLKNKHELERFAEEFVAMATVFRDAVKMGFRAEALDSMAEDLVSAAGVLEAYTHVMAMQKAMLAERGAEAMAEGPSTGLLRVVREHQEAAEATQGGPPG